jgi:hypothetical protein
VVQIRRSVGTLISARAAFRIFVAVFAATLLLGGVRAQTASPAPAKKSSAPVPAKPEWNDLTPSQKEALAPLAKEWNTLDKDRKAKWIAVAKNYPSLTPDKQAQYQQRMTEFAKLTPEQRRNVRENFRKAYELPLDQRQALIQQYNDMPPERKKELADKANSSSIPQKPVKESRSAKTPRKADGKNPQPVQSAPPILPGQPAAPAAEPSVPPSRAAPPASPANSAPPASP